MSNLHQKKTSISCLISAVNSKPYNDKYIETYKQLKSISSIKDYKCLFVIFTFLKYSILTNFNHLN